MDEITNITQFNFMAIVLGCFAILFAVKEIIEIVSYFKKKLRIKFGTETDKESIEDRLAILEKHDKTQYDLITKISSNVEDIKARLLNKEIGDIRYEILDFASALSNGREYTKEQFDHVLAIYQSYEKLLIENNMENGQVTLSMEIIDEVYKENLKNGFLK